MNNQSIKDREVDEEFIRLTILMQNSFENLKRHDQIKLEKWIVFLAKISSNYEWKKNRNLHAKLLLHCVQKKKFICPFDKLPKPNQNLEVLNTFYVKNKVGDNIDEMLRADQIEKLLQKQLMSLREEDEESPREEMYYQSREAFPSYYKQEIHPYEKTPSKRSAKNSKTRSKENMIISPKNNKNSKTARIHRDSCFTNFQRQTKRSLEFQEKRNDNFSRTKFNRDEQRSVKSSNLCGINSPKGELNEIQMREFSQIVEKNRNKSQKYTTRENRYPKLINNSKSTNSLKKSNKNFENDQTTTLIQLANILGKSKTSILGFLDNFKEQHSGKNNDISEIEEALQLIDMGTKLIKNSVRKGEELNKSDYHQLSKKYENYFQRIEQLEIDSVTYY